MVLFPTQDLDDIHCLLLPHTMHFQPYLYGNGILAIYVIIDVIAKFG